MSKRKVLYVCHNHPSLHPGGAEGYALELYEAMRESDEFEPLLLARIGSTVSTDRCNHPGTLFSAVNDDPNQYFIHTETAQFDWLLGTARDKEVYTKHFREFLRTFQPDIVHFQHTLFLGYDALREVRNTLPDTPIVYTLHEYLPICHRDGQMVRMRSHELCIESSPRRCHECFPEVSPQAFFMRKRFIQSHMSLVDLFLAPSHFLLERYVAWGIPREKIRYEEYGRRGFREIVNVEDERPRNRIGFFGQFNFFKGVNVLLQAISMLSEQAADAAAGMEGATSPGSGAPRQNGCDVHVWLHGANLELQSKPFQEEFYTLLETSRHHVTLVGRYDPSELPRLMASIDWVVVPSIWWENSPLVIQEAFSCGRPVICSDIGGMAEKVTGGVNGLHFRRHDPASLAETIRRAVTTPGLWDALRQGIPDVYNIDDQVVALGAMYQSLLDSKIPQR